jgi:hypothetical protein
MLNTVAEAIKDLFYETRCLVDVMKRIEESASWFVLNFQDLLQGASVMPMQRGKSGLAAKLGDRGRKAAEAHRSDPVVYSEFSELPAGIEGGVAQLVDCKFDVVKPGKNNAGSYYFYAAGVVVSPLEHEGTRVEGLRTSVTEPLYDTPGRSRESVEDHIVWVQNELKKLGVGPELLGFDDLEGAAAALVSAQPYFKFRTWKGAKTTDGIYKDREPRVQSMWNGMTSWNGDSPSETTDNTKEAASDGPPNAAAEPDAGESFSEFSDDERLGLLAVAADAGDAKSAKELTDLALAAGIDQDDVDSAENWAAVAEGIKSAGGGQAAEEEAPEEEEAPWEPAKGETYKYGILNPKTKRKVKVDCEVVGVDKKSATVSLKRNDTKGVIKGVKWADLESAEE